MKTPGKLSGSLGYWVHRVDIKMRNRFLEALGPYDLTPPEWAILNLCNENGILKPSEIAEQVAQSRSLVSRWLTQLVDKGLLVQELDPTDRRARLVKITARGIELLPVLAELSRGVNLRFLAVLDEAERAMMMNALQKLATDPTT